MDYTIYKVQCLKNNKCYIGITNDFKSRIQDHKKANGNFLLAKAVRKHGVENFQFNKIGEVNTWQEACEKEKAYIKEMKTKAPFGYNMTDGGEGTLGWNPSEETRKKYSLARKGRKHLEETKKKISISNTGKKISQECKEKLSISRLGKKHKEESKIKMLGRVPWNKGKKNIYSNDTLSRMSSGLKKYYEHNDTWNKGIPRTEEEKRKMSLSKKGKKLLPETIEKIRQKHLGSRRSEETKNKMRLASSAENSSQAKLNWDKVNEIRDLFKTGSFNYSSLSRKYKVTPEMISKIIKNKNWVKKES